MRYERVRTAFSEKKDAVHELLNTKSIALNELMIYLRIFKQDKKVELWGKNKSAKEFKLLKSYTICSSSGTLGPKRQQGDLQVPEGFYYIDRFNPVSNFYLSLGINYPNYSDRILGRQGDLGGDIFIHGACVTIGCVPITDDQIKELYVYAVEARNNGQTLIPVTIFPERLTEENFNQLISDVSTNRDELNLWADLKTGYNLFNQTKTLPKVRFLVDGRHIISSN